MLLLEKNPDLFPRPNFCSCKVRTHATQIPQLKLMGNVAFVCISKNKPLNPYLVILYKIVGSSPPHLCKKNPGPSPRPNWSSVTSGSYTCIWKFPNKSQWETLHLAVSLQLSPKHPALLYCISLWRPDLAIAGEKSRPFSPTKLLLV